MPTLVGMDFALGLNAQARDFKSDGWKWHKTRLRQPDRAERHWLAMSVAMLWMITLGGEQEVSDDESLSGDRFSASSPILSCFLHGLLTLIAQLLNGQSISFGRLFPLPLNYFSNLALSNSS